MINPNAHKPSLTIFIYLYSKQIGIRRADSGNESDKKIYKEVPVISNAILSCTNRSQTRQPFATPCEVSVLDM